MLVCPGLVLPVHWPLSSNPPSLVNGHTIYHNINTNNDTPWSKRPPLGLYRERWKSLPVPPVCIVELCTGVVLPGLLPGLLLGAGLQAAGGVAGVVVLSLATGLLPEHSLHHL